MTHIYASIPNSERFQVFLLYGSLFYLQPDIAQSAVVTIIGIMFVLITTTIMTSSTRTTRSEMGVVLNLRVPCFGALLIPSTTVHRMYIGGAYLLETPTSCNANPKTQKQTKIYTSSLSHEPQTITRGTLQGVLTILGI